MQRRKLLPDSALDNLGTLLDAISKAEDAGTEWTSDARIHFLRNYTTEPIDPYLQFHLIRDDIRTTISHGGYGTMTQELLDPTSTLCGDSPDVVVLSLLLEFLDPRCLESNWVADDALRQIDDLAPLLLKRTSSIVIINTLLPPIDILLSKDNHGVLDIQIERLNSRLTELETENSGRLFCVDVRSFFSDREQSELIDRRFWNASQAPFRRQFLNSYAKDIAYYVRVLKGRAKKCLVLDCDNTIWGGVIGEDGLQGIELSDTQAPGIHYWNFQKAAIALHDQGVMLALCSKNNEDDVWTVLDDHPSCALQRSHLVGWRINWQNKATNLTSLADELNIGLDSMVFVDDSPQEQALINETLSEVLVLAVPDDLEEYANLLHQDKLFDTSVRSDEDRHRTTMYQDEAHRKQQRHDFEDLTEFLKSLQTVLKIVNVDRSNIARVSQLTQKTNQFNLTTKRYSEADIGEMIDSENSAAFVMSVNDRYGDMGITGVFVAHRSGTTAKVDTMLLSCRVLGRKLEFAFAHHCLAILDELWPDSVWHANYDPTKKNAQTKDFWNRMGFTLESERDGHKHYTLDRISHSFDYSNIIATELEQTNVRSN